MTPGDCGSAEQDGETISEIRRGEARASAALIGAEAICLEFRDLAIFNDDESRRRVVEALRRTRPDLVLTAPPADYLCDHEMTSLLVRDACFGASCPNYATRQWDPAAPLDRIPHLYFVDPMEGVDRDGRPAEIDFYMVRGTASEAALKAPGDTQGTEGPCLRRSPSTWMRIVPRRSPRGFVTTALC